MEGSRRRRVARRVSTVVAARRADRVARVARLAPILTWLSAEERSTIAAALPALRRIAELGES
jgi:hypothetical protein